VGGVAAQFFDNSGVILSGGKIYTYAAGTTTNQTTYTSSSGSTSQTNPIILDSAGRVPSGEIWLTTGISYKFVIKTSTDVLIGTYDNITGINDGTNITLNASNVEYDPPFTNGVTSNYTVTNKFSQYVSVKDFGAIGNGTTDDTTAIQNAINALQMVGGGCVYFPAGTFRITGTLTITVSGIRLTGAARGGTTLNFENGANDCISVYGTNSSAGQVNYTTIDNFVFSHTSKTGGRTFVLAFLGRTVIRDIVVNNCWTGAEIWVTNDVFIENVIFQLVTGGSSIPATYYGSYAPTACYGIWWHAPADGSYRSDQLTLINVTVQALFSGANGMVWDGAATTLNAFQLTFLETNYGLRILNTAQSTSYYPVFGVFDNYNTDGVTSIGTYIESGVLLYFVNSFLSNTSGITGQGSADTNALKILSDSPYAYTRAISFVNCRIGVSKQSAAVIASRDTKFIGCIFESGSTQVANTFPALEIETGAQDIVVSGCSIYLFGSTNNWKYGFQVNSGTFRILLTGNNLYNAQTQSILWNNTDLNSGCTGNIQNNPQRLSPGGYAVTTGVTLSAARLLGGALELSGPTAPWTATTDTAVNMVALLANPAIFTYQTLVLINTTAYALTLSSGTGVLFSGNLTTGSYVVPANSQRTFTIVITNPQAGSQSITFFG
jgi:hypothetical protein